jgi:hypothetical protein
MRIPQSVAEVLDNHVTLELECIDRMYLNVYVPQLQREQGVVNFFRYHRGHPFASSALMDPISKQFIAEINKFVEEWDVPLISFEKGQRKDDIAAEHMRDYPAHEGIFLVGKAQEKARVFRTEKRRNPKTGQTYPWIVRSTAMVNHFYFYGIDRDFGPFFIKFCTYFPYTAKLYINGHEWAKQQATLRKIPFEALDNGFSSCAKPQRLQALCEELEPDQIEAFLRKWLKRLPHPFSAADRKAGYTYQLSILQAEFSLTQVLDRPLSGRIFFEEVIRENLDLGRPDRVQLIFDRRVTRRTPGRFRTRVLTDGVTPSLHVDYKSSRIKQYHKEGRALRTETTINNTRDFGIGKRLCNLPQLREIGFHANRRLLDVQRISHDCTIGEDALQKLQLPQLVEQQRVSAMRFADPRVQALFTALLVFRLLPEGFSNKNLRAHLAPLLGLSPAQLTPGRMTYDLRRLRLRGLIERLPNSHRYQLTALGLRTALFFTRTYSRVLRRGVSLIMPDNDPPLRSSLRLAFEKLDAEIHLLVNEAKLAA